MHPDNSAQPSRPAPVPYTVVELVDPSGADGVLHKVKNLHINGQPVTVEAGSTTINFGNSEITSVTLTLLPDEIHFIRKDMP